MYFLIMIPYHEWVPTRELWQQKINLNIEIHKKYLVQENIRSNLCIILLVKIFQFLKKRDCVQRLWHEQQPLLYMPMNGRTFWEFLFYHFFSMKYLMNS